MAYPRNYLKNVELLGCPTLDDLLAFHYNLNQLLDAAGTPMTDQSGAPASSNQAPQAVLFLTDVYAKLGKLEARQDASDQRLIGLEQMLKDQLKQLQEGIEKLDAKVDDLSGTQAAFKGGWKALAILGGIIVTVGGIFSWIADHWTTISSAVFGTH